MLTYNAHYIDVKYYAHFLCNGRPFRSGLYLDVLPLYDEEEVLLQPWFACLHGSVYVRVVATSSVFVGAAHWGNKDNIVGGP